MNKQSNGLISPIIIDLRSLEVSSISKNESIPDKLCYSTSDATSFEDLIVNEEEDFLLEISKNQHKITSYISDDDLAYSSRSNILTWASKLLNAVTLTNTQKQSIFHRFSTAYDLINERLYLEKHPIVNDKVFKKFVISLFLIVYKLEGYTIGKITIKSLIEAFLHDTKIKETDIRRTELRILKLYNYNCFSFEDNLHNLSLIICEMIKKKYSLSTELTNMIDNNLYKMNRIIQFSNSIIFDVLPIDKAAISVFGLILFVTKSYQSLNKIESYSHRLVNSEMALLINDLYSYLKTVLKVINISQSDFMHYSSVYCDMMKK